VCSAENRCSLSVIVALSRWNGAFQLTLSRPKIRWQFIPKLPPPWRRLSYVRLKIQAKVRPWAVVTSNRFANPVLQFLQITTLKRGRTPTMLTRLSDPGCHRSSGPACRSYRLFLRHQQLQFKAHCIISLSLPTPLALYFVHK
jgi:hypothetical protein